MSILVLALCAQLSACGGGGTAADVVDAGAADTTTAAATDTTTSTAEAGSPEASVMAVRLTDKVAPTLTITSPTTAATYDSASATVNLAGSVTDNTYVNGVTWSSDKGLSGTATLTGTQPKMSWKLSGVALQEGVNNIKVVAKDKVGNASTKSIAVTLSSSGGGGSSGGTSGTLITDQRMITIPSPGTYPAKGTVITDPVTGMKITRVSDKSELTGNYGNRANPMSAIVYSRFSPANTAGDYYLVHGVDSTSAWIYRASDHKMMTVLRFKPSMGIDSRALGEVNELRWDYSGQHPYRLYFVGRSLPAAQRVGNENPGMSFYYVDFDPTTGTQGTPVVVRDFTADFPGFANAEIMNDVEGDSSNDSRYWAWQVMNTALGSGYKPYAVFSFDMTGNKILGRLQRSCAGAPTPCVAINTPATAAPYLTRPNMVEMSPLGTRVVVDFDRAYAGHNDADIGTVADGPKAFLPDFSDPIRIGSDATHSGWAWGPNGEEMFVSQNNRNDWIEAVDVRNATTANCKLIGTSGNSWGCGVKLISQKDLDGGSYTIGYHFGKVYDRTKRGYVYMNTYDSTGYNFWGKNQGLLVQINDATVKPSKVVRLGSTYNSYYDYRSEGSGALDFRGENVWTTGNWGFTDGRGDVIKIQLPPGWATMLPK